MAVICDCPDCNNGEVLDTWKGYCENAMIENEIRSLKAEMNKRSLHLAIVFALTIVFVLALLNIAVLSVMVE